MIQLVILMLGVLALLAGISASILQSKGHEQQLVAKQVATSTMESIMSVKETDPTRLGWGAIGNVGTNPDENGVNQGIFPAGLRDVYMDPGPDEIIGTTDDTGTPSSGIQAGIPDKKLCEHGRAPPSLCPPGDFCDTNKGNYGHSALFCRSDATPRGSANSAYRLRGHQ